MATHHPGTELLLDYSAGALKEPVALLVATHLALCPRCRAEAEQLESVGGALLDDLKPQAMARNSLKQVLARLDEPDRAEPAPAVPAASDADLGLPRPLRDYVGSGLDGLAWKSRPGLAEAEVLAEFPGFKTRLMKIEAGRAMPRHTHEGSELTLVLSGGFSDAAGHYLRGDVAVADASVDHQPVADPGEECLCLAVTDAPLKLTGPFGRLLNPFVRI